MGAVNTSTITVAHTSTTKRLSHRVSMLATATRGSQKHGRTCTALSDARAGTADTSDTSEREKVAAFESEDARL